MIWESEYWKKPLVRLANKFAKWTIPREWKESELVVIEKEIFIAFYSIRKLKEAQKLSKSTEEMLLNITVYPNKGKKVTLLNWDQIDALYDFTTKKLEQKKLDFIYNQIIHSYVFIPEIAEDGVFEAILFCSDKQRNKNLFRLEIDDLINLLHIVGTDYPSISKVEFNDKTDDFDIVNK